MSPDSDKTASDKPRAIQVSRSDFVEHNRFILEI